MEDNIYNLMGRALIGDVRNMCSDILEDPNARPELKLYVRERAQYMHRFRKMEKRIKEILKLPKHEVGEQVYNILKDGIYPVLQDPSLITHTTCPDIAKKLIQILDNYGIKPSRKISYK